MLLLEGETIYDEDGIRLYKGEPQDLVEYLRSVGASAFVNSFSSPDTIPLTETLIYDQGAKVIANKTGIPIGARIQAGRETRWIVSGETWGIETLYPGVLRDLRELYQWYGVGYKPSPSSLGTALMREVWKRHKLPYHTALNSACEEFIRKHATGGIVQTPGKGKSYDELLMLDMSSAWVSQYVLHPTGTAISFRCGDNVEDYGFFTYFAECEVFIPYEIPLGPFPKRRKVKDGKRVTWPTLPGVYKKVYLWKEQVEDCRRAGCYVKVYSGYGWRDYTTDNSAWSQEAYVLRKTAHSDFIEGCCKRCAVSAIGHHAQGRKHYELVGPADCSDEDSPLVNEWGEAMDIYLHEEEDLNSALMVHWYAYTVMMCNHLVYQFALPYAKEGRLVAIDYDSILIVEKDERHQYVARKDFAGMDLPPGTWLYIILHNVMVPEDRHIISDEVTKRPGISRNTRHDRQFTSLSSSI